MPKLIDLDDSAGAQACLSLPLSAAPFIHFLISHLIRPRVTALLCKTRMLEVVNWFLGWAALFRTQFCVLLPSFNLTLTQLLIAITNMFIKCYNSVLTLFFTYQENSREIVFLMCLCNTQKQKRLHFEVSRFLPLMVKCSWHFDCMKKMFYLKLFSEVHLFEESQPKVMLCGFFLVYLCVFNSCLFFFFSRSPRADCWCWILCVTSRGDPQQVSLYAFAQSSLARDEPEQRGSNVHAPHDYICRFYTSSKLEAVCFCSVCVWFILIAQG